MPNPELQFNAIQSTGNRKHVSTQLYFPKKTPSKHLWECPLPQLGWGYDTCVEGRKGPGEGGIRNRSQGSQCFNDSEYFLVP